MAQHTHCLDPVEEMHLKKFENLVQLSSWILHLNKMLNPITAGIPNVQRQILINAIIANFMALRTIAIQLANIFSQAAFHDFEASTKDERMRVVLIDP